MTSFAHITTARSYVLQSGVINLHDLQEPNIVSNWRTVCFREKDRRQRPGRCHEMTLNHGLVQRVVDWLSHSSKRMYKLFVNLLTRGKSPLAYIEPAAWPSWYPWWVLKAWLCTSPETIHESNLSSSAFPSHCFILLVRILLTNATLS